MNSKVFSGPSAALDSLNPNNSVETRMVELTTHPFHLDRVRIFVRTVNSFSILNIKSLPVYNMLQTAKLAGMLEGVNTIVEATSGNTGMALAVLAPHFGIQRTLLIVPQDIAAGKLDALRSRGAEIEFSRESPNQPSAVEKARLMGQQKGFFNLDQYRNPANPEAHEKWTAPPIWKALEGKLTIFCAGLGTTGTITGCSRYFKMVSNGKVTVVGTVCHDEPEEVVPGVRSISRLKDIRFDWREACDAIMPAGRKAAFKRSREIFILGPNAGPASGFAYQGLLSFIEQEIAGGTIHNYRNKDGEVVAAFVCTDTEMPYGHLYSAELSPSEL